MISFINHAYGEGFFSQLKSRAPYHFGSQNVQERNQNKESLLRRIMQAAGFKNGEPAYDLEDIFGFVHKCGLLRAEQREALAMLWMFMTCRNGSALPFEEFLSQFRGQARDLEQWLTDFDDVMRGLRKKMNEAFLVQLKQRQLLAKASENCRLFEKLFDKNPPVIFTTNFDTVFEALEASALFHWRLIDGVSSQRVREFNLRNYLTLAASGSTDAKLLYLFKLHGSVTWEQEESRIIDCYPKLPENAVVAEPVISKNPDKEPFVGLYEVFTKTLKENSICIAIGFSFRDDTIRSIVTQRLDQSSPFRLIIVAPDETGEQGSEGLNNCLTKLAAHPKVVWIKSRFGEKETEEAILMEVGAFRLENIGKFPIPF